MKQYLNSDQTAKLIELGFEKPRALVDKYYDFDAEDYAEVKAYSIGELIELVNQIGDYELRIFRDDTVWSITTDFYGEANKELIDAIYCMLIRLKEEGVI